MFKSPRRNGRNKSFRIKHFIQISMLLGVTTWLIYQIHNSDDKKSSVTTNISQKLSNGSSKDIVKLGRKDLRPKLAKETKPDDEQNNKKEGISEDSEDHNHENDELEEVGENEHAESKEDSEEIKENENEKENDDKSHEQSGKFNEITSIEQKKVAVMENIEKKMSPSMDEDDDDDHQSINDELENGKDDESDTNRSKQPSVDHNEHNSKHQIAQQIGSAPDSYSYGTNTAKYMKLTEDKNMKADSESQAQSKNGNSEQKDDVSIVEEEKNALADLESLPEGETRVSISLENAATE